MFLTSNQKNTFLQQSGIDKFPASLTQYTPFTIMTQNERYNNKSGWIIKFPLNLDLKTNNAGPSPIYRWLKIKLNILHDLSYWNIHPCKSEAVVGQWQLERAKVTQI